MSEDWNVDDRPSYDYQFPINNHAHSADFLQDYSTWNHPDSAYANRIRGHSYEVFGMTENPDIDYSIFVNRNCRSASDPRSLSSNGILSMKSSKSSPGATPHKERPQGEAPQHSRHARRLYIGGIPPGHTNEDLLKSFLNEVISKCLEEEIQSSHILSVYMNHKKYFAFIELKSVELTTACLELDGIVYKNSILKIQRANEYKPELVSSSGKGAIKLNLVKAPFPKNGVSILPETLDSFDTQKASANVICRCNISDICPGSLVLIGFPYDEGAKRAGYQIGSSNAPHAIRTKLKILLQQPRNPEYDIDFNSILIYDVGDIPIGMLFEDALKRLEASIGEIIRRGGLPIIFGGSSDVCLGAASGLLSVVGNNAGIISIDSKLNCDLAENNVISSKCPFRYILDDHRFCTVRYDGVNSYASCDARLIFFGAQGNVCSYESASYAQAKGSSIIWLNKDIRGMSGTNPQVHFITGNGQSDHGNHSSPIVYPAQHYFKNLLIVLSSQSTYGNNKSIYVNFSAEALKKTVCPANPDEQQFGLTSEEGIAISHAAGLNANVSLFSVCNFNPEIEEAQSSSYMAEIVYYFLVGVCTRQMQVVRSTSSAFASPPSVPFSNKNQSYPPTSKLYLDDSNPSLLKNHQYQQFSPN